MIAKLEMQVSVLSLSVQNGRNKRCNMFKCNTNVTSVFFYLPNSCTDDDYK